MRSLLWVLAFGFVLACGGSAVDPAISDSPTALGAGPFAPAVTAPVGIEGKWTFTINGQQGPTVMFRAPDCTVQGARGDFAGLPPPLEMDAVGHACDMAGPTQLRWMLSGSTPTFTADGTFTSTSFGGQYHTRTPLVCTQNPGALPTCTGNAPVDVAIAGARAP